MVQMAPNNSSVTAIIDGMETYAAQADFYVVQLKITGAKKTEGPAELQAEKGEPVKALLSKERAGELNLQKGMEVNCEIKKVSPGLWKVAAIAVAAKGKQKKK